MSEVKTRLDRRASGENISAPWSYHNLCKTLDAEWRAERAPWQRAEGVCGSYMAAFEGLGAALHNFSQAKREGRKVGFSDYRRKGRCAERILFQHARPLDARHVQIDRRLGPVRSKERLGKLLRRLERDPHARVLRATVKREHATWYISFTVRRAPKDRRARRPDAVVGGDVGLTRAMTTSTGRYYANARPLKGALRKLRRLQRSLDRQRRAANPANYKADGTALVSRAA